MNSQEIDDLKCELRDASSKPARATILIDFMRARGNSTYDEQVTQLEHAIQAGVLARQAGSDAVTTVAALMHDIGHFLTDEELEGQTFREEDWLHEELGAHFLNEFFDPRVGEAARLHVDAKRYLCAVDADYHSKLSPASVNSLKLQGGPMTESEVKEFEQNPSFETAAKVRRWDDLAKDADFQSPPLETFTDEIVESLK